MKRVALSLVLLMAAVPAFAQGTAAPVSAVSTIRNLWKSNADYIATAAAQMPESDYSYKPVSTVRSFGEILGHVAGAEYMSCAAALGETPKAEDDIEKTVKTKAGLVAALKSAAEYCGRAYSMTDADATGMTKLFGMDQPKLWALVQNATHIAEHYGNIVTYMRMKNMVPPSSQPRAGGM